MKAYRFKIEARQINAIGKLQKFTKQVNADNFKEAALKLYTWYDHIMILSVNGETYNPYKEPE